MVKLLIILHLIFDGDFMLFGMHTPIETKTVDGLKKSVG